ncbi:universal stress protein [Aquimarina sp. U1-2]|uniref:universal stress protein n=1 Tax=Aquimarina sp. U1-2 TaxID=2823141 RepID=UPI001AECD3B8|nr:universal stress protein [Aquimarina sp. U1-2]MBP2831492.1 universal stress protein [Aquimarina sp. U1-2]
MKRILVPTDFSHNVYSALLYATRLFQNEDCEFLLLHTFKVNTPLLTSRIDTNKGKLLFRQLYSQSQEKLRESLYRIRRDTEDYNHSFEMISVSKELTTTINKTIKNKKIDLVVMGTKGASGVKEVFIGSNTVSVTKKIEGCAVLAVPDEHDFKIPKEIALTTDFKRDYSLDELVPFLEIAAMFKSHISVLHIYENEKLSRTQELHFKRFKKYLEEYTYSLHWVSKFDQKTEVIKTFLETMKIDLLTMFRHKHGFFDTITREPVVKKIGFEATIPFLVIPSAS